MDSARYRAPEASSERAQSRSVDVQSGAVDTIFARYRHPTNVITPSICYHLPLGADPTTTSVPAPRTRSPPAPPPGPHNNDSDLLKQRDLLSEIGQLNHHDYHQRGQANRPPPVGQVYPLQRAHAPISKIIDDAGRILRKTIMFYSSLSFMIATFVTIITFSTDRWPIAAVRCASRSSVIIILLRQKAAHNKAFVDSNFAPVPPPSGLDQITLSLILPHWHHYLKT